MSVTQSRHGTAFRAVGLGLAGLVVALAVVGCWHDWATTSQIAREFHTATLLPDGRVLIAGGMNWDLMTVAASAELYDPATGTFSPTGPMATARAAHTATLLADGRVLITGGEYLDGGTNWAYLSSAELYDPKTGKFSPSGSMVDNRFNHTATLLSNGRVLIAGGYGEIAGGYGEAVLDSAELYDPETGRFSPTGAPTDSRVGHTATLLDDGRVLIAGGGSFSDSAELYDPKTGTFIQTGPMTNNRYNHAATLLQDGRVLVAGGLLSAALASAELYDPKTGQFSPAG
jgi:hypothetical protein